MDNYSQLKRWREQNIGFVLSDPLKLSRFHDKLMVIAVELALEKIKSEQGLPPACFSFFVMGSAGRHEQSVWSDQDHGIIYGGSDEFESYFIRLGEEITLALSNVGYEYCDGKVMASNPLWCKSISTWEEQILRWLDEESWESLRYFSTFFDSRVLIGDETFLTKLKEVAFLKLNTNPNLYCRLLDNVSHLKKGVGIFGQLLTREYGEEAGKVNLKENVFFPYVNSMRLLALKANVTSPSTLARFRELSEVYRTVNIFESDFVNLLNYRLRFQKQAKNYRDVHLLSVGGLTKQDKHELKWMMKQGYRLFSETKTIIEKDVQDGDK